MMACRARQYSDQMVCHACGLAWDMNDPEPPDCNQGQHVDYSPPATVPAEQLEEPANAD